MRNWYEQIKYIIMSKVFQITPKCTKHVNGTVLTPEMEVTVEVPNQVSNPFYADAYEVQEAYMCEHGFDYKKAGCTPADFNFQETESHNSVRRVNGQIRIIDPAFEAYKKRKNNKKA